MKNKIFAAAFGLAMMGLIAPASAGCDGIYLSGKVGIVNHNLGDTEESLGKRLNVDDNAWILAGAIGYRYGYFRFEAEYTWRERAEETVGMGATASKEEFQTSTYMANIYYDFSPYTMFTPYVMAGAGITHIEYNFSGGGGAPEKYEADNFTWAVGGGVSAKMTNRWNIDIGYRFLNMKKLERTTIRAHEVYLGTRYVF
jgi:opacity protein-like surface antigen